MFWKRRKNLDHTWKNEEEQAKFSTPGLEEERGDTAAKNLARALAEYERHAIGLESSPPDSELDEAYRRVRLAKEIVDDGRISYALCYQLLEHIKHWPTWIERDDFEKYIIFDAHDIVAQRKDEGKRNSGINVSFAFREMRFCVVFVDKGYSAAPGDSSRFGEIELYVNDDLVLLMDVLQQFDEIQEIDALPHWESSFVKAFTPGDWMRKLMEISAQIEVRNRDRLHGDFDQKIREASANIRLPDEVGSNEQ